MALCRNLNVSPSGYHAWAAREPSDRDREDEVLSTHMRAIHKGRTGARASTPNSIAKGSARAASGSPSHEAREPPGADAEAMRSTIDSDHGLAVAPNLLERNFTAAAPDQVWVADITYIWT